jgi:hypothetical protein
MAESWLRPSKGRPIVRTLPDIARWRSNVSVVNPNPATNAAPDEETPDRERARAIRARQRALGRELRRLYDNVVQEPVPGEFLELLQKIDSGDGPVKKAS